MLFDLKNQSSARMNTEVDRELLFKMTTALPEKGLSLRSNQACDLGSLTLRLSLNCLPTPGPMIFPHMDLWGGSGAHGRDTETHLKNKILLCKEPDYWHT
ncbi:unnamed protein product [Eretmochelys imbricata]